MFAAFPAGLAGQDCSLQSAVAAVTIASQSGSATDVKTTSPFVATLSRTDAQGTANGTADGPRGSITHSVQPSSGSTGIQSHGVIQDCFAVTGVAAGTQVSVVLRFRFSGNVSQDGAAILIALFGSTTVTDFRQPGAFDATLPQTINVTAGTAFNVASQLTVSGSGGSGASTATVVYDFSLPPGATLQSAAGFGGGGVPPPVTPVLSVSGTSLSFTGQAGANIAARNVPISNAGSGALNWTASATSITGGNWLRVSPASGTAPSSLTVTPATTGLGAGVYIGQITITASGAQGSPATIFVTLILTAPPPTLAASPAALNLAATAGAAPFRQTFQISSLGAAVNFSITPSLLNGAGWLSLVSPASGTLAANTPSTVTVEVNPRALAEPGVYQALITIIDATSRATVTVPVTLALGGTRPKILLSQAAFVYTSAQSATAAPQTLTLQLSNSGTGTLSFGLPANPAPWLRISPATGTAGTASISLTASPAGMTPGVYQTLVPVSAAGAANDGLELTVTLHVVAPATPAAAELSPQGLVFVAVQGAAAPAAQNVSVRNNGGGTLSFQFAASTTSGGNWLAVTPAGGSTASGPADVRVSANPAGLAAGVYRGKVTGSFTPGVAQEIEAVLVVSSGPLAIAAGSGRYPVTAFSDGSPELTLRAAGAECIPSGLELVATTLGNGATLAVSFPRVLIALAVDSCGTAIGNATLVVTADTSTIPLQSLSNGLYTGTWVPQRIAAAVPVSFAALHPTLTAARRSFTVSTAAAAGAPDLPVLFDDGVVEGAGFTPRRPLAPGGIVSLFGARFGTQQAAASRVPLERELAGVSVRIGGQAVPLYFVSSGQINAQVPFEVAGRENVTVAVNVAGRLTAPQNYLVAPAQPGVFRTPTGVAVLDGQSRLITPENPARLGDTLQIFATGLGVTDVAVESGAGGPPSSTVRLPVTVTIGGVQASVVFQGLAPNFVGLYQVNAVVPASVPPGDAVQVVLRQNGITSNPDQTLTLPVRPR